MPIIYDYYMRVNFITIQLNYISIKLVVNFYLNSNMI